ncbi:MAG: ABC transporter permease [Gammaproteobacteria bacterium]
MDRALSTLMRIAIVLLLGVSLLPTLAGLAAALVLGFDAAALARVLATPGIGTSIGTSLFTGIAATGLSLALAHLAVAAAVSGGWRDKLNAATLPLLALPHLAIGIGLALVIAPSGLLLRLLSPWATGLELPPDWHLVRDPAGLSLILGLVIKETCFLIMALMAALSQVPVSRLQQTGAALGYGPLKAWLCTIAPLAQTQIRLPLAAVLVFGITNVELAITLGPGLPPTFAVVLWQWFTDPDPTLQAQAYAGSLLLIALVAGTLGLGAASARLGQRALQVFARSGKRRADDSGIRRAGVTALASLWVLGGLSFIAIALRAAGGLWRFPAVLPTSTASGLWQDLAPSVGSVTGTTLVLGLLTAVIGVALVLPAAEQVRARPRTRRHVGIWLFIPLVLPQMTFLFGVQILLTRWHLDGQFVAVVWAHLVFALPYLWGVLAPARAALDPKLQQVAYSLGSKPFAVWRRVTLPLLARSTLLALALGFSVSVALYLPTLFAGAGRVTTAATEAAAAAGSGSLRVAALHAILLCIAPLTAFAAAFFGGAWLYRHRQGVPK